MVASENGNPSFSDSIDVKCAISILSSFSISVLLRNNYMLHEENSNIMMNRFIFSIYLMYYLYVLLILNIILLKLNYSNYKQIYI